MNVSSILSKDWAAVWSVQPESSTETREKIRQELEVGCTLLSHAATKYVLAHNHGANTKESLQQIESAAKYLILTLESISAHGYFLQRELTSNIHLVFHSLKKLLDSQSVGLLWKALDALPTVSLTDSSACQKVLKIQLDSLKDAYEEWLDYEKDPKHPLTLMIQQAMAKIRRLIKDMHEETNSVIYDNMAKTAKKLAAEVDDAIIEAMENNDPEAHALMNELVSKLTLK